MNVPISWIREFAPIAADGREYADIMTMLGQKVERYDKESDGIEKVVTGRIISLERHPNADKLSVCRTDAGNFEITVVTGADNISRGDIVPVALDGAALPGGHKIVRSDLRGVTSEGMFCSLAELGFTKHDFPEMAEDGIMILPPDTPIGISITELLHLDDTVFEFEITPNRPDCLSVAGLARETAAVFDVPFTFPVPAAPANGTGTIGDILKVTVKTENCLRYTAGAVKNVRIAPSPQWMRERLRKCGLRPINNIVDITNYVMLEFGQPMHAFDLRHVRGGEIVVRQAAPGETIVTLDGTGHTLDPDDMVIADAENPSAVAGVMGGEYSGIYDDTETVIFESACFDRLSVRFTAKKLGLRTDSSARFEKGLDPHNALPALFRALQLVKELGAGEVVNGIIDIHGALPEARVIPLRVDDINARLGTEIPVEFMENVLSRLGFSVNRGDVTVPAFRADVSGTADLAEEIARMYGYNRIPSTIMSGIATAERTERQVFERALKNIAAAAGLFEATTLSFMSGKSLDAIRAPEHSPLRNAVKISNPLGEDTGMMRTTLLPALMEAVARNWSVRAGKAALFELASVYIPGSDENAIPDEPKSLSFCGYGDGADYYAFKGIVERMAAYAGTGPLRFLPLTGHPSYHPGRAAAVYAGEIRFAVLGELHPDVAEHYGVRARCAAAEIDLEALFPLRSGTVRFRALPRFPAVTRDLALIAPEQKPAAEIESVIRAAAGGLLESAAVFDVYRGAGVPAEKKSVAYSLVLRDGEKTLTDAEADAAIEKILAALLCAGVTLRS